MIVVTAMPVVNAKASSITTKIFFMTFTLSSTNGSMPGPARRAVTAITEQAFPAPHRCAFTPAPGDKLSCCFYWCLLKPRWLVPAQRARAKQRLALAYVHTWPAIAERFIADKADRDARRNPRNRAAPRPDDQVGAGRALAGIGKRMSGRAVLFAGRLGFRNRSGDVILGTGVGRSKRRNKP